MIRKFANAAILEAQMGQDAGFAKSAHRAVFNYTPREGYLYVRSRAISSRCNDNFDMFPAGEIESSYHTFLGKPVFVNHHNDDHRRARGVIIDAALHKDINPDGSPDTWVELLHEVDAVKFPKLAKAILAKEVNRTSMGCDVQFSKCSVCHNVATSPLEYCSHIPGKKGKRIFRVDASTGKKEGTLVFEICSGLSFFENSLLVEQPADPTAYFLGEVQAGPGLGQLQASVEQFIPQPERLTTTARRGPQPMSKTASRQPAPAPQNKVWNLLTQAAKEDVAPDVWSYIREAVRTNDDSLEFESAKKMRVSDMNEDQLAQHHQLREEGKQWVTDHPPKAEHVVNSYNRSMHHEREQGDNWYPDAHHSAVHMAEHTGLTTHQTSHLLAIYSPQAHWAANMHMAAHVARTRVPLGGGGEKSGGFSTSQAQANQAERVLNGEHGSDVIGKNGHKIRDFGHLIEHGGDTDPDNPRAVIDRHASSVARGARIPDHAFDALNLSSKKTYDESKKAYVDASKQLSEQHGRTIHPHQVQATTWLVQQRENGAQDRALVGNTDANGQGKTEKVAAAHLKKWQAYAGEHFPGLADKAPGTGYAGGEKAGTDTKQGSRNFKVRAYGETKAPQDVDTLRAENCTVCGNSSAFDGKQCQVCGYVAPPKEFGDPNTDIARSNDLRKQIVDGDEADPMQNQEMGNQQGDPGEVDDQQADAEAGEDTQLGTLTCTSCGTGIQPAPPVSDGGEPPYPAEGDVCPVCKQGQLMSGAEGAPEEGEEDPDEDAETDLDQDGIPDKDEDEDKDGVPDDEEDESEDESDDDEDEKDPKKKAKF